MTLRLRLVLALVALVTLGLGLFGVVTYRLYARSELDRLDEQLESTEDFAGRLFAGDGEDGFPSFPSFPPSGPGDMGGTGDAPWGDHPPPGLQLYAELRPADGSDVQRRSLGGADEPPDLPDDLPSGPGSRLFTTGSVDGSTEWRVLVTAAELGRPGPPDEPDEPDEPGGSGPHAPQDVDDLASGDVLVVAFPLDDVRASLDRLVLVEAIAAGGLLAVLAVGAWLVLRRGLRPLERMAATARTLNAGDLHTRVTPADERSEVGQLGLALNTMLGRLEQSFAQQEATEQRLRQFLADAAHELRTPLTSVQGFAELFRLGADQDAADLAIALRRIEEDAARMRTLVDDLLLLARLDQTRPVERAPVDLAVVAAEACSDVAAADPAHPITLDAPEPVVVPGDRDHLRQAVGNLVANAVRHTPAGTPVEVAAHVHGDRAMVQVRDHGGGLDDEALAHVFDRFWQANPSRAEAGAGLGLSIVAGIAAEHGGTATAANAADGPGAVFTLDLPLDPATPDSPEA